MTSFDCVNLHKEISHQKTTHVLWLAASATLLFLVGTILIFLKINQATLHSIILLMAVIVAGVFLCEKTSKNLQDPHLRLLSFFWLIKLAATLFLLFFGWMPQLDPSSLNWGYDPQRYFFQANELRENAWAPDFLSLNYTGILYYYGAIYSLLGFNAIIPALVNAFVTVLASLFLIKTCYKIKGRIDKKDWTLSFVLLIPEVLWFDVLTSRETLLGALLIVVLLTLANYFTQISSITLFKTILIITPALAAIAAIRTSMLLPVVVSGTLMVLLIKSKTKSLNIQRTIAVIVFVATLFLGPIFTGLIGGYHFDIINILKSITTASLNIATLSDDIIWSKNSIGALLLPNGWIESILFTLPRMILYLVAPLPNIFVSTDKLIVGDWDEWQRLCTLASSLIYLFSMPYVFASLIHSIQTRKKDSAPLALHIAYWTTFIAIAGGNLIIHERYRVMSSSLLFAVAWLGFRTSPKPMIVRASIYWYCLLTFGALFYLCYKTLL